MTRSPTCRNPAQVSRRSSARPASATTGSASSRSNRCGLRPSARASGGADELAEQRRRPVGPALELGVGLGADPERVRRAARRTRPGGRRATCPSTGSPPPRTRAPVAGVELVAVAVPLGHDRRAVGLGHLRARRRARRCRRRAASCRPCRGRRAGSSIRSITGCGVCGSNSVEFAPVEAEHVAGEVDGHHLQAEAQPEARDAVLAGVAGGGDLALDAALAEPAGDDDAVEVARGARRRAAPRRPRPGSSRSRPWRRGGTRRASAPRRPTGRRRAGSRTCR